MRIYTTATGIKTEEDKCYSSEFVIFMIFVGLIPTPWLLYYVCKTIDFIKTAFIKSLSSILVDSCLGITSVLDILYFPCTVILFLSSCFLYFCSELLYAREIFVVNLI